VTLFIIFRTYALKIYWLLTFLRFMVLIQWSVILSDSLRCSFKVQIPQSTSDLRQSHKNVYFYTLLRWVWILWFQTVVWKRALGQWCPCGFNSLLAWDVFHLWQTCVFWTWKR
jgi:hypothetical protein